MSRQLTVAELTKAAHNLRKIELYLAARRGWKVDPSDHQAFKTLRMAANRLAFTVGQRALALGIDAKLGGQLEIEELPSAVFEGNMLQKCGAFLGQLDGWFVSQGNARLERGGDRILGRLQTAVDTIRTALIMIDQAQETVKRDDGGQGSDEQSDHVPREPEKPQGQPVVPLGPPVRPVTTASDDIYEGTRGAEGEIAQARTPPAQIAFTMSDAAPMYTWVGSETVELTPLAKEKIEKLFDDQGISYFKYQLEKFSDEVRMRIETAPEGHVLVVKVRSVDDEIKPFLSYVAADAVK